MKKFLCIILSCFVLLAFSGCVEGNTKSENNTDYMKWTAAEWNVASDEEKEAAVMELMKFMMEENGISMTDEMLSSSIESQMDVLIDSLDEAFSSSDTITLKTIAEMSSSEMGNMLEGTEESQTENQSSASNETNDLNDQFYETQNEQTTSQQATSSQTQSNQTSSNPQSNNQSQASSGNGLTTGQRNALEQAKSYLSWGNFSKQGLIDQLLFEGYSQSDAEYAVNNCGADWNAQALGQAKSYLSHSSFSYSGLIGQLEFEGYTNAQAIYGVDHCGADWNEQAVKTAASYLSHSSFSRDQLISQLEFEGFTHEQAVYGVSQNGY